MNSPGSPWLHLRQQNGLDVGTPSPGGFYEDAAGSVWIAGSTGVAHFTPHARWFEAPRQSPPPVISRLTDSGRHIKAWVGGLDMPAFQVAPIEYRLLPSFDTWRGTSDGNLEFLDLPDAGHTLEARYAGLGTSPVARREIRVGPMPQAFPWTAFLGGVGVLALAGGLLRRTVLHERGLYRLKKGAHRARVRLAADIPESAQGMLPGDIVDERYQIVGLVAHGGFSRVYEARDTCTGHRLAERDTVSGHAIPRWEDVAAALAGRPGAAGRGAAYPAPSRRRSGHRPQERDCPPGSQAGKRHPDRRRSLPDRFRNLRTPRRRRGTGVHNGTERLTRLHGL